MYRSLALLSLACARTHGSSPAMSGSNADRNSVGSRNIRSSGATNPSSGLRYPLPRVSRYAPWIHSRAWY
ncbi:hypothetical protein GCM10027612_78390 [Microbispora bryophytorum subsp. camponoti]